MNHFVNAVKMQPFARTENGAMTHFSSQDPLVDLFNLVGASRGKDITSVFSSAYSADRDIAARILLWARDVRQGAGERQTARNLLLWLESNDPDRLVRLIPLIPEVGRWDDLLIFSKEYIKQIAYAEIAYALANKNGLCAKWMPRKGAVAKELTEFFGLSPRQYRKLLVKLTNVVETQMCAKDWDSINFEHVPSVAASLYAKAFNRHTPKYAEYKSQLKKGTAKINASVIFPHTVVQAVRRGDAEIAQAQWDSLPNYLGTEKILPIVDVSGSMVKSVGGTTTAMDVSVGLGLYLAEKQTGPFKDMFMTFSSTPQLQQLQGNLRSRLHQIEHADWQTSTNIDLAFEQILTVARRNRVPKADMPSILLILSDMEFNHCGRFTAYETLKQKYAAYGYDLPKVVFWNIVGRLGNAQVQASQNNVALVSGFSPAIMTAVLKAKTVTPREVMLQAVMKDRYEH